MTWSSHRGDEWWYSGAIGKLEATCDGRIFSINTLPKGMYGYQKESIYMFLLETFDRLKEFRILISTNAELEEIIEELSQSELISIEVTKSRYGNSIELKGYLKNQLVSLSLRLKINHGGNGKKT